MAREGDAFLSNLVGQSGWPACAQASQAFLASFLTAFVGRGGIVFQVGAVGAGTHAAWCRYLGAGSDAVILDGWGSAEEGIRAATAAVAAVGPPDIVVDLQSASAARIATFEFLYPCLVRRGIYAALGVDFSAEGAQQRDQAGEFPAYIMDLADELCADNTRGLLPPTEFSRSTFGLHFAPQIVVFERGQAATRATMITGRVP